MSKILIMILVMALIYVITKIIYLKKDIRNINNSLQLIRNNNTNKKIVSISMNKDIIFLAQEINLILDQNLKDKIKYEKNNKKLKEMITNISHDLRTPLTSIKGYIQYMNGKNMNENEINKYLTIVNEKAIILQELLDSFFELSRIQEKSYPITITKVDISNLLTEVLFTFYNEFTMQNIKPKININERKLLSLVDEKAMKRIFINLLQNILKHQGKEVEINLYSNQAFIVIEFKNKIDNLKQDDIKSLKYRFSTVNKIKSNRSEGIGLSISKKLVEQMNGTIETSFSNNILCISIKLEYYQKNTFDCKNK